MEVADCVVTATQGSCSTIVVHLYLKNLAIILLSPTIIILLPSFRATSKDIGTGLDPPRSLLGPSLANAKVVHIVWITFTIEILMSLTVLQKGRRRFMICSFNWRVTLKSIHPREVKVLPKKRLRKLHDIISLIETGVFMDYIVDKMQLIG